MARLFQILVVLSVFSAMCSSTPPQSNPLFSSETFEVCRVYLSMEGTSVNQDHGFFAPTDLPALMKETSQAIARLDADIEALEERDWGPLQPTDMAYVTLKSFQEAFLQYSFIAQLRLLDSRVRELEAKGRTRGAEKAELAEKIVQRMAMMMRIEGFAEGQQEKLLEIIRGDELFAREEQELRGSIAGLHLMGTARRLGFEERLGVSEANRYIDAINEVAMAPAAKVARYPLRYALRCAADEQEILRLRIEISKPRANKTTIATSIGGTIQLTSAKLESMRQQAQEIDRLIAHHSEAGVAAWMEATKDPEPDDLGGLMTMAAAERGSRHNSLLPELRARHERYLDEIGRLQSFITKLAALRAQITP